MEINQPQINQQPQTFDQTPEAQEYLQKLQQGRVQLPPDATPLEREAFERMTELAKQVRQLSTGQSDLDKDMERLKRQREAITRDIDVITGQMTAFATLLVSAEGSRRTADVAPPVPTKDLKPEAAPVEEAEPEAAPPAPTSINKRKGKTDKAAQPSA